MEVVGEEVLVGRDGWVMLKANSGGTNAAELTVHVALEHDTRLFCLVTTSGRQ